MRIWGEEHQAELVAEEEAAKSQDSKLIRQGPRPRRKGPRRISRKEGRFPCPVSRAGKQPSRPFVTKKANLALRSSRKR
ncbi:MAG: hypothetical protein ACLT98_04890 [Eggerthellaceae bacterium]